MKRLRPGLNEARPVSWEARSIQDIGIWSHYVGDASQPLHVSVHWRARPVHRAGASASATLGALGRVLKAHGARYSSHIRDESHAVHEAVAEAIDIGEQCGVHVQIAHMKLSGTDSWG
jgi:hypothetical protein